MLASFSRIEWGERRRKTMYHSVVRNEGRTRVFRGSQCLLWGRHLERSQSGSQSWSLFFESSALKLLISSCHLTPEATWLDQVTGPGPFASLDSHLRADSKSSPGTIWAWVSSQLMGNKGVRNLNMVPACVAMKLVSPRTGKYLNRSDAVSELYPSVSKVWN